MTSQVTPLGWSVPSAALPDGVGVRSILFGDEVGHRHHSSVRCFAELRGPSDVPRIQGEPGQRIQGEELDVAGTVPSRRVQDCDKPFLRTRHTVLPVERGKEALPQGRLLPAADGAMPCDR